MKDFHIFLKERKVKKISIDNSLADSLLKNVDLREKNILPLDETTFSLLIFENTYDCIREILDAILALKGYKSYSHEAPIAYLKEYEASEEMIHTLDRFRTKRNDSKYYGKSPSVEDAKEIKKFYNAHKKFFMKIINEART